MSGSNPQRHLNIDKIFGLGFADAMNRIFLGIYRHSSGFLV